MGTKEQTQGGGMNKKTLTLIGFVAVIATAATLLFAADPKEKTDGKFHVVYLVSVVDLKPGAKAFVDPVFFTDGKQIKSFHNYCRSYLKRPEQRKGVWKMDPRPQQIVDNLDVIYAYCKNTPVTIDAGKLHTLNNTGLSIRLGSVNFNPSTTETNYVGAHDLFPHPGSATLTGVSGRPLAIGLDVESESRPQQFFLMSSNKSLLLRVVPVRRYKTEEMERLIKRARYLADEAKGRYRRWDDESRQSPAFVNTRPKIVNALFADIDGDGVVDASVGLVATTVGKQHPFHWGGLGFLTSTKGSSFFGGLSQQPNYEATLKQGYVDHAPFALLRIGSCSYIFSMLTELGKSYQMVSQPLPTKVCPHLNLTRIEEPVVD